MEQHGDEDGDPERPHTKQHQPAEGDGERGQSERGGSTPALHAVALGMQQGGQSEAGKHGQQAQGEQSLHASASGGRWLSLADEDL